MAIKVSKRSEVPPFIVMQVMNKATAMAEEGGEPVIHMEIGQPSTPAVAPARRAIVDAIDHPASHGYTDSRGTSSLRRAIAGHYRKVHGIEVSTDNIIVTVGSSMGFAAVFLSCFEAGDKIAITNPGYSGYANLTRTLALDIMRVEISADTGWRLDRSMLERLDTIPDGLMITSPANPTGAVLDADTIRGIADWCNENGVRLISDEIYHGISFGAETSTALAVSDSAVVVNSFSKYFSMTGHRVGWVVVPDELTDPMTRLGQNMVICPSALAQIGATAAITDAESFTEADSHVERYRRNRDIIFGELDKRLLGNISPPEGGFYVYLDTSIISDDSVGLADRLLTEARVATTTGVDFDPVNGHKCLRLSFAGSEDEVREGVRRINEWMAKNC